MSLLRSTPTRAPTLVLAVGNPSRGDDAAGPWLADQLDQWLSQSGISLQDQVEVLCDQQLMVEHALDLVDRQRVLFIDAAAQLPTAFCWTRVSPSPAGPAVSSHQCTPAQLLQLCADTLNAPVPPCWLLSVRGEGFELGAPVSQAMQQTLNTVWPELCDRLTLPADQPWPTDHNPDIAPHHA